jgi:hypothetical protein
MTPPGVPVLPPLVFQDRIEGVTQDRDRARLREWWKPTQPYVLEFGRRMQLMAPFGVILRRNTAGSQEIWRPFPESVNM